MVPGLVLFTTLVFNYDLRTNYNTSNKDEYSNVSTFTYLRTGTGITKKKKIICWWKEMT